MNQTERKIRIAQDAFNQIHAAYERGDLTQSETSRCCQLAAQGNVADLATILLTVIKRASDQIVMLRAQLRIIT
jgi:hypothetical protein